MSLGVARAPYLKGANNNGPLVAVDASARASGHDLGQWRVKMSRIIICHEKHLYAPTERQISFDKERHRVLASRIANAALAAIREATQAHERALEEMVLANGVMPQNEVVDVPVTGIGRYVAIAGPEVSYTVRRVSGSGNVVWEMPDYQLPTPYLIARRYFGIPLGNTVAELIKAEMRYDAASLERIFERYGG